MACSLGLIEEYMEGRYSTHCFRNGGAQYRFMYARIRWALKAMKRWGGWSEGQQLGMLIGLDILVGSVIQHWIIGSEQTCNKPLKSWPPKWRRSCKSKYSQRKLTRGFGRWRVQEEEGGGRGVGWKWSRGGVGRTIEWSLSWRGRACPSFFNFKKNPTVSISSQPRSPLPSSCSTSSEDLVRNLFEILHSEDFEHAPNRDRPTETPLIPSSATRAFAGELSSSFREFRVQLSIPQALARFVLDSAERLTYAPLATHPTLPNAKHLKS
ncbi:hypothetical protein BDK51DRAFT_32782 [Blyttiomyces helicus]|uniref:Uncharacterized protein n=1 Tax=Blyttiomyces helicus TaxID=388810 RepID=A0A4P9VYG0_9FUNG|nr:hypothetical protein BDK51DRAFT_32782 [Blyttiomyces helicus]|eukprot:RKO84784.1 hypothetical protein BDK51DRAFT_32782 [Blyttiomyces helicus]